MTNIQAADLLKGLEQSLDDYCELNDEGKDAFRMAITALESFGISEQLPSAQPEPCEDAVSRRRLLSDLKELTAAWGKYPVMAEQIKGVEAAIGYVKTIPSVTSERKKGKWIPCSKRLPEEHIGFYLVTVQKRRIAALNVVGCDNTVHDIVIVRWDYDRRAPQRGYHWCNKNKVIAWMPLPEPYGGDQNG